MREHRYRAWDSYQKKMYSWDEIGEMNSHGYLSLWNALIGMTEHITMLESTGLKDANGIEIYEGDIVSIYENMAFPVIYDDKFGSFHLDGSGDHMYGAEMCEVIGNVWENPELLKGA